MPQVDLETLWNEIPIKEGAEYPHNEKWYSHLLDQYKLYVEMADRISQRRTTANQYFLAVNTAILGFVGYLTVKDTNEHHWLIALAGVALTYLWYVIITSYRNLNTAKWAVVHEIEKRLPIRPYDAEWKYVDRGTNPILYRPLSHVESLVPWIFMVLHAIVFVKSVNWLAVQSALRM